MGGLAQGGQPCHPYHEVIRALQAEPAQDWQPQPQPRQRCEWVSTPRELQALRRALAGERRIALDCEHNALRSYLGLTCLVQISAGEKTPRRTRQGPSRPLCTPLGQPHTASDTEGDVWGGPYTVATLWIHDTVLCQLYYNYD